MNWEKVLKSNNLGQKVRALPNAEGYTKVLWEKSSNMKRILDNSWSKLSEDFNHEEGLMQSGVFNWFNYANDNLVSEAITAGLNDYQSGGYDYSMLDPQHEFAQFMNGLKALI